MSGCLLCWIFVFVMVLCGNEFGKLRLVLLYLWCGSSCWICEFSLLLLMCGLFLSIVWDFWLWLNNWVIWCLRLRCGFCMGRFCGWLSVGMKLSLFLSECGIGLFWLRLMVLCFWL